jgi:hypothetical protein
MIRAQLKGVPQRKSKFFKLDGGEDLVTPPVEAAEGSLLFSRNYESLPEGGYQKTGNYERFDGMPKPSEATYYGLAFDAGTVGFTEGETVTGGTSGATGVVLPYHRIGFDTGKTKFEVNQTITGATSGATAKIGWIEDLTGDYLSNDAAGYLYLRDRTGTFSDDEVITSDTGAALIDGALEGLLKTGGLWSNNDAVGVLYLYQVSGTFQDNEALTGSSTGAATANGTAELSGGITDPLHYANLMHAIALTRDDIGAVPGSGTIRGLAGLNGTIYAFRDNAGGTAMDIYKSTTSGWSQLTMPAYIDFDTGTGGFTGALTVTGGTSGATATIDAVIITGGTTGGGNQTGRLYLSSVVGTFQNNEALTDTGVGAALANGANDTVALSPGGRVETYVYNFGGTASTKRIYGVDGVNSGFELSGDDYYPIPTTQTTDTPDHVFVHKGYLFFSFTNSVQHCGTNGPRDWTAISGAVEIATGDDIVGFAKASGDVLLILNRNKRYLVYGDSPSEWDVKEHSITAGGIEWTLQNLINTPIYCDDPGMYKSVPTDTYGNFDDRTISKRIEPYYKLRKGEILSSLVSRTKSQYRLYFTDGTGIHMRLDRKIPAPTRIDLGKPVYCTLSTEDSSGSEVLFFGSDDGYVYQLDVGRSADGDPIEAYIRLPFWHIGSPRVNKEYLEAILQLDAPEKVELTFLTEFDYGSLDTPRGEKDTTVFDVSSGGGFWGISTWNNFIWGAQVVGEGIGYIFGQGANISMLIRSYSASELPHTLNGIILEYMERGLRR